MARFFQRQLFREPVLYFVIVGALVFAVDHALRSNEHTIRLTPAVRNEIVRVFEARLGRLPSANETDLELKRWTAEEALYREGLRMRLYENDIGIRARLVEKVAELGRLRTVVIKPTETELREYFANHRDLFTAPPTYDFEQVFVSHAHSDARARAEQILAQLREGAPKDKMGDPFLLGSQIKGETTIRVSDLFGERVAKELPTYSLGEWNFVEGTQGFHVLRVTHIERISPDFEKLRDVLISEIVAKRQERAAEAFNREIMAHYRLVTTP
jgi:hypothetical protein